VSLTVRVVVPASRAATWDRWTDLASWPGWNPMCARAALHGPLVAGSRLELELVHPRGQGRTFWTRPTLTEVRAPELIAWEAVGPGVRVATETELSEEDDGTLVTLRSATSGVFGKLSFKLLALGDRTQARMYAAMLNALVAAARRPA
jgi:uncharacterized protein YndB with AHSA1/START domain